MYLEGTAWRKLRLTGRARFHLGSWGMRLSTVRKSLHSDSNPISIRTAKDWCLSSSSISDITATLLVAGGDSFKKKRNLPAFRTLHQKQKVHDNAQKSTIQLVNKNPPCTRANISNQRNPNHRKPPPNCCTWRSMEICVLCHLTNGCASRNAWLQEPINEQMRCIYIYVSSLDLKVKHLLSGRYWLGEVLFGAKKRQNEKTIAPMNTNYSFTLPITCRVDIQQ